MSDITPTEHIPAAQQDEGLEGSAERLSLILDNVKDIVFLLGTEPEGTYRFLFVSPSFLTATGLNAAQVIGRHVQEVIPEPAHALVLGKYAEAIRERRAVEWQETSVYPSGERVGQVRVIPIFDGQGRCTHLLGTVHDITAQRHAQERSEQLFSLSAALGAATSTEEVTEAIIQAAFPIFQATVGLVALLSEDGRRLDCVRIVGVPAADAERWRSFPTDAKVPLADAVRKRRLVMLLSDEVHDSAYPEMAEERLAGGDGALVAVPLLVGGRCIGGLGLICPPERCRDEEQQTFLWTLAGQCALSLERARLYDAERRTREEALAEVAERRRTEAALRESEQRLRLALDGGNLGTWHWDLATGTVDWPPTTKALFGLPPGASTERERILSLMHPEDRDRAAAAVRAAMKGGPDYDAEYRVIRPDGSLRWIASRGRVQRDERGTAVSMEGVVFDITARKAAEEDMRWRAERERFLADLAERARRMTDPQDVIADAVRSVGEFFGVSRCIFADIDIEADTCTILPDYRAEETVASIAGVVPISAFGPFVVAEYAARRAVAVDDVRADPIKAPPDSVAAYEAIGIRAHVTVPVVHSDRIVSCLSVHNATPRHWQPEEIELLHAVVERTWLTVEVLRQEQALAREAEERREAHERVAAILESITDAFFALDAQFRFTYVNAQAEQVLFRTREELLGRDIWELFLEAEGSKFDLQYRRAMREGVTVSFEEFYPPLATWFEVRAFPSEGGLAVFFRNVNERKQAEAEREQLLAEQQARAEREALLNRVGQALRASPDPEQVLVTAVRELGAALRADHCYYAAYDQDADTATVGPDWHRDALPTIAGQYPMSPFAVNHDPIYKAGHTQVVTDTAGDAATQSLGLRALVRVPLVSGASMTALAVAMSDSPRAWTAEEISLIESVASLTRSAVEAARLLAERQAHLQEEALLGRIGVAIRSTLDPDQIQERAATLLGEALRVDRCFYVTYDLARDYAEVSRDWSRGDLPSLAGEYRASDFALLLDELFPAPETAVVDDVRTAFSPAVAAVFETSGHRAALVVPFFDEERLVAALYVSEADAPRVWTAEEAALVEQVATLTRTALVAARIQQKEHRIAEQLQDALQPDLPAHVPGLSLGRFTQPALDEAKVGGDFYDVFPLDKELYAIVIGDVSGKGLAAAQQLALVRNSLRTTLYLHRAPALAAATLNSIVTAHDLLVGFVTAWVGVYDGATGEVVYCSCGHEPALIRRASGGMEALDTTGPPLGVAENAEYSDGAFTLTRGDALLLYTDGMSEAGPSRREMLGTEGLMRLFKTLPSDMDAADQTRTLVGGVFAFAGGVFRDDVAVLLARRQ